MSMSYHFHPRETAPLTDEVVTDSLNKDFIILNKGFLEGTNNLRFFCVRSKNIQLEADDQETGLCFVWSSNYNHYGVSELHFGGSKEYEHRVRTVLADVAKKLKLNIEDVQSGELNIPPDEFQSQDYNIFERSKKINSG